MICPRCQVDKPSNEFPKKPQGPYSWICRACERNRASLRKYGITNEQKAQIAAHVGGCAICGHEDPGSKGWTVDHDHNCCAGEKSCPKCRRGVLCSWCNKMLAYAFDRPQALQAAIDYLRSHADGGCAWHIPVACAPRICGNVESASCTDRTDVTYEESLTP